MQDQVMDDDVVLAVESAMLRVAAHHLRTCAATIRRADERSPVAWDLSAIADQCEMAAGIPTPPPPPSVRRLRRIK